MASALALSPGNVSYHFARRADLVSALVDRLSEANEPLGSVTISDFEQMLARYSQTLRQQYDHRGVVIALPSLMDSGAEMRRRYRQTERRRFTQQRAQLAELRALGHLHATDDEIDRLVTHIALIARFWLPEYRTTHRQRSIDTVISHYVGLIADLFVPYAAGGGRDVLTAHVAAILPLPGAAQAG